jgi:hypothetical protein
MPALLRVVGHGELRDLVVGEARGLQSRRDLRGGLGAVAAGDRGVGLDQLLVEREELLLVGTQRAHRAGRHLRRHRTRHERRCSAREDR